MDFYVFRNAKRMPDDVRASLVKIIETYSSSNSDSSGSDGEEYLLKLEKSGRYQLECWS